jgi:hypothetical protein
VFANVVFECHNELHVLSNLLPLPSVIRGGMLAYRTAIQQPFLSQHFFKLRELAKLFHFLFAWSVITRKYPPEHKVE